MRLSCMHRAFASLQHALYVIARIPPPRETEQSGWIAAVGFASPRNDKDQFEAPCYRSAAINRARPDTPSFL